MPPPLLAPGSGLLAPSWLLAASLIVLVTTWALGYWFFTHTQRWSDSLRTLAHWLTGTSLARWFAARYPRLQRFLRERLTHTGYLGLHLTIGLVASIATAVLFASVAESVVGKEELAQYDVQFAEAAHREVGERLLSVMRVVTACGSAGAVVAESLVVMAVLALRHRWSLVGCWVAAIGGGALLDAVLKYAFRRPRPAFSDPFVTESSWSFPSGHSMGAILVFGMLAYLLARNARRPAYRGAAIAAATTWIMLIGLSRLLLGAHYPSDVLGGYAAGATWLLACITATETVEKWAAGPKFPEPG